MSYLIVGGNSLINNEINKLIKENNIENNSIIKYDLFNNNLSEVIEDLNTMNLFGDKKCIICFNIDEISDVSLLENYLNNPSDNLFIVTCCNKNDNKLIYNLFNKKKMVINIEAIDLSDFIKKELKDYKIDSFDINYIIICCNYDYNRVKNEVEKLKMYKFEEKEITKDDISKLIKKGFDNDIFDLIDAIDNNNKDNIFHIFNELVKNNEAPIKILITLANNYRLLYQVKELMQEKNDEDIMKILDIKKPGRLYFLKKKAYNYTTTKLLNMLVELSEVDINIKSGKIEEKTAIELFFSKI